MKGGNKRCRRCGMPLAGPDSAMCPACLLELGIDHDPPVRERAWMEIPKTGQRLGDYELLEELGRGGMGVVYRARQGSLDREVALKILSPHLFSLTEAVDRFRQEAQTAAALHHPGVVAIHECGQAQDFWYLVMELVEGRSLDELVHDQALPPRQAARYLVDAAEAVQHAHAQGVLHRDLKPSNILVDTHDQIHLTDFGLATHLEDIGQLTLTGQILGSPSYLSAEQAEGKVLAVDERSDVYALGAVLYHLLTARPPFAAESVTGTLTQVVHSDPVPPRVLVSGVPRDLETICLKCLEKEPSARFASAQELADDLRRFLQHEPIRARPVGTCGRLARWSKRNLGLALVGGAAVVLLLAILIGAPLATLRVAQEARRALHEQRRVETTLRRMDLHHAEDAFENGRTAEGLAILALLVREDPNDRVAAQWLLNTLTRRDFPLLTTSPLRHPRAVQGAWFTPDGLGVLAVARDNQATLWDPQGPALPLNVFTHDPNPAEPVRYTSSTCPIVAALSPDGTRVATASVDNTACVWNLKTGQRITAPMLHPDWVTGISFSPDGRRVATAGRDGTARVWDATSGDPIGDPLLHEQWVNFAVFSPDGERLLTGADEGAAVVWDVATGRRLFALSGHTRDVKTGVFSPEGERILTVSSDGTARLWHAASGAMIGVPMVHDHIVVQGIFSPDGLLVATASFDHTARLWDAYSGTPAGLPLRHDGTVRWVAFSPEGERLATASEDGTAIVWDIRTSEALTEPIRHTAAVWSANFSADGSCLVTSSTDCTAQVWDIRQGQALPVWWRLYSGVQSADWSADGALLALGGHAVELCDVERGTYIIPQSQIRSTNALVVQFGPSGQQLAVGNSDGTIEMLETEWGTRVGSAMDHGGIILDLAFSPSGRQLASASSSGTAAVWDAASGRRQGPELHHEGTVNSVEFSPDGRHLLTSSSDGLARLFPVGSAEPVRVFEGHEGSVVSAEFSPDGGKVLTASEDGTARLWDLGPGNSPGQRLHHRAPLVFAHFGPDGKKLLTGCVDGSAGVWSAADGQLLAPFVRQAASLVDGDISADGCWMATGAVNGLARIWDADTGQLLDTVAEHSRRLTTVRFDPTSRHLLTTSMDRSAAVTEMQWTSDPAPAWLPRLAEAIAGHRLDAERMMHPVTTEEALQFRAELQRTLAEDSVSAWLKWFLGDRWERPISPQAGLGNRDYIEQQRFVWRRSVSKLRRLLRRAPDNGAVTASLADALLHAEPGDYPHFLARADWLVRRAATLDPGHPEVEQVRVLYERVCQALQAQTEE